MNDLSDNRASPALAFRNLADAIESGARIDGPDLDLAIGVLLNHRPVDPSDLRKLVLRRYWQKFYPGMHRTRAANVIASDWLTARTTSFAEPGSRDYFFQRLEAIGFKRVCARTIVDYLDHDL